MKGHTLAGADAADDGLRPRTPSQRARRQRIIDAALDLLQQREYDRIQMRDVAEAAGVALGTLYRYFPSKEQLFAHALLEWSLSFEATVRPRSGSGTPQEKLSHLLRRAATAFERHPHYFQLLTILEVVHDPAARAPFEQYGYRFRRVVTEALDGLEPDDADAVTALVLPLLAAELRQWSRGTTTMREVHRRLDRAVDLVFRQPRSL